MTTLVALGLTSALLAATTASTKQVSFLGFSKNESLAAWQITYTHPVAGSTCIDRYSLIRVVESNQGQLVATLRGTAPERRSTEKRGHCPVATFEADYPDWRTAAPLAEWQKLKRSAGLHKKPIPMNTPLVRIARDRDSTAAVIGESKALTITGKPGEPLGYVPVGRLANGEHVDLGRVREEGIPGVSYHAELMAYHSRSALRVALLHQLVRDDQSAEPRWFGTVYTLPEMLASTDVNALQMMHTEERLYEQDYKKIHPGSDALYDEFVGSRPTPKR